VNGVEPLVSDSVRDIESWYCACQDFSKHPNCVTQGPMPIKGFGQVIPDTISSSISDGVDKILL